MTKVVLTDLQAGYKATTTINENNAKIEQALDNTLSRDGSTPNEMEAPLDLNSHKILNVSPGVVPSDAANLGQLQAIAANLPASAIEQIAVRVAEILGDGVVTPPINTFVEPGNPGTPVATAVDFDTVTITWTPPSPSTWVEGYEIRRQGVSIARVAGGSVGSYTDNYAPGASTLFYTVTAYNDTYLWESTWMRSNTVSTPANTTVTQPGTPTGVAVVQTQSTSPNLTISWQYASAAPVDTFEIFRNNSLLSTVVGTNRVYTDATTSYNGTYTYKVRAVNTGYGYGTDSSIISATVGAAPVTTVLAPSTVTLTALSSTSIRVDWLYNTSNQAAFVVHWEGPTTGGEVIITNKAARSHTITALIPSTSYQVTVSAIDPIDPLDPKSAPPVIISTLSGVTTVPLAIVPTTNTITTRIGETTNVTLTRVANSGLGTGVWAIPVPRTGLSINSSTGMVTHTPVTGQVGTFQKDITLTDSLNTVATTTISFVVQPARIVITPNASVDLTASSGVAYDSQTYVITGGEGTLIKYVNGVLPTGIVPTITSNTVKLSGTGTLLSSGDFPFTIAVTDSTGQTVSLNQTLVYTSTTATNYAPVWTTLPLSLGSYPQGDTGTTLIELSSYCTDATTITYAIGAINLNGTSYTAAELGIAVDNGANRGRVTTNGLSVSLSGTASITFTASDGLAGPKFITTDIITSNIVGATSPVGTGWTATGGGGTFTYAVTLVSGSSPAAWLGTFGSVTAGKYPGNLTITNTGPCVLRCTATDTSDNSTITSDVSINTSALAGDSFANQVLGTKWGTDFTNVYVDGVQVRTISSLGTTTNASGTLLGEATGFFNSSNISWVTDPSGYQAKAMRITTPPSASTSSAAWIKQCDGDLYNMTSDYHGTAFSRMYFQVTFRADRNLLNYRYQTGYGDLKLFYLGVDNHNNQLVVALDRFSGFYHIYINGSDPIVNKCIDNRFDVPTPNPWGSSSLYNKHNAIKKTGVPAAQTKLAYYNHYGMLLGGSKAGLEGDMSTAYDASNPWLDLRTHTIETVQQAWPCAAVVAAGDVPVLADTINTMELFFEYRGTQPSSIMLWAAKLGDQPKLLIDAQRAINFSGDPAYPMTKHMTLLNYDSTRIADANRPIGTCDYLRAICSLNPIRFPGTSTTIGAMPPGAL